MIHSRVNTNPRLLVALLLLMAAIAATVATTPAHADEYMVTVRLDDGTLMTVIADLPAGATLADAAAAGVPGTPVALEPHSEPPQPAPAPAPAPPEQPDAAPAPPPGGAPDAEEPPSPEE